MFPSVELTYYKVRVNVQVMIKLASQHPYEKDGDIGEINADLNRETIEVNI